MTPPSDRIHLKVIFALTLVHFTGDFYSSFITPLFPLFIAKLGLSLAQVGMIAGLSRFLAFIVQPAVGYLADRHPTRTFALGGLLLAVVFIPLSGIAPSYGWLLPCVAVGSVGSSMFHPAVTGMVPLYAGRKVGLSMSVFNTGGTLAFAVGPLFITAYAAAFHLEALPFTMLLGIAVWVYLWRVLPHPSEEGIPSQSFWGALQEAIGGAWKAIALIWLVMVLRAVVGQSLLTFMPVLYVSRGYSVVAAGVMISLFTLAGTASGIYCGQLSDRIGYKPIFVLAHAVMTPVLLVLLVLHGWWVFAGVALSGAVVLATLPLGVVMAQSLAPKGRSMVASMMMGFAYGLGGIVTPLVGKLADAFSVEQVLRWLALLPLATLVPIFFFPRVGGEARDSETG